MTKTQIKLDKDYVLKSLSNMFQHRIKPINAKYVKRIDRKTLLAMIEKGHFPKSQIRSFAPYLAALRKAEGAVILLIEKLRTTAGDEGAGFVIAGDIMFHKLTGAQIAASFPQANEDDSDDDDDDPEEPGECEITDHFMSCFCANPSNCSCSSTYAGPGNNPGDSCATDVDCGGTGTSPNPGFSTPAETLMPW